jgi:putative ABC transport system ATP-binding protein
VEPADDLLEVGSGNGRGQTLKQIVSTQGDDTNGRVGLHAEVQAGQAIGGRVTRNAGAANKRDLAQPRKGPLNLDGKRLASRETEAGGDRVSENGHHRHGLSASHGRRGKREPQQCAAVKLNAGCVRHDGTLSRSLGPGAKPQETILTYSGTPLVLEKVSLTLRSSAGLVEILRDVDLLIEAGERVAVVGPSGSGKSSLISVAAGLEAPTSGHVHLLGQELSTLDEDARARLRRGRVSLIFQSFHLLPNMTAEENVAAPLEIAGRRDAMKIAREWLLRVGLSKRTQHYAHQLSGGEQQRVAIARALAPQPELVFADEPTGNLDAVNAAQVTDLILDLAQESGAALLLVTHDAAFAARADRQILMADGRAAAA